MDQNFSILFIVIIALIIGFVIGKLLTKNTLEKLTSDLEIRNKLLLEEKEVSKLNFSAINEEKNTLSKEKHEIDNPKSN